MNILNHLFKPKPQEPAALHIAHEKRRLERLLRDHDIPVSKARKIAAEFFTNTNREIKTP